MVVVVVGCDVATFVHCGCGCGCVDSCGGVGPGVMRIEVVVSSCGGATFFGACT